MKNNVATTGIEPISAEPKSVVLTVTPQGIHSNYYKKHITEKA